jgi:autotransporter-associated beta strand protein
MTITKRNRRAISRPATSRARLGYFKLDRAAWSVARKLAFPIGVGSLFMAHSAYGQTETYQTKLSDIQITQTAGVGATGSITNPNYVTMDAKGALANATDPGTTAAGAPILTYSQLNAANTTYQLINTITNNDPTMGPPSSSAYASVGESDSFALGMGLYLGSGTGITQTNPGGAYPYASELSLGVQHLSYFINASAANPFPSARSPSVSYQFPIAGSLPVGGSANFGVTLSFYFYPSTNTTNFAFPNTGGTLVTTVALSENFTNTGAVAMSYTNATNAALFSGHAQFYGLADQLIKTKGYFDIEGSINLKSIVDSPPPGSPQGGSFGTGNGNWTPAPTSFEMYLPQLSMFSAGPSSGNTFDATGTADLTQIPSWTDTTNGTLAPVNGPPLANDIAQFANGILTTSKAFNLNAPTTWGGISVINPGAAVNLASGAGTNTLTIGNLGIAIAPDPNGVSQNLTLSSPVAINSGQTWYVTGGQNLNVAGSSLNIGANSIDVEGAGNVYLNTTITDGGAGGALRMNGTGTVFLNGSNSYTGGTFLNNGEVAIFNDSSLGGNNTPITFNGGTLQVRGTNLLDLNNLVVNYNSFSGGLDIQNQNITFTIFQPIGNAATDSGSLTKDGQGTLTFFNTVLDTYNGPTTINGGALLIPNSATLNHSSNIIINSANGLELPTGVEIDNPMQVNLTSGEFLLLPAVNETITLGGAITTGANPADQFNLGSPKSGATINFIGSANVTPGQATTLSEGTINFNNNGALTASPGNASGIVFGGGPSSVLSLTLSNSGSITNLASTGGTLVNGSIILANLSSLNLGAGNLTIDAGASTFIALNGGTFTVGGFVFPTNASGVIEFNGGVLAAGATNAAFLPQNTQLATLQLGTGGFKFDSERFNDVIASQAGFTPVTNDGGVTKEGPGALIFSSVFGTENINRYTGPTTVYGGLLDLPSNSATNAFLGTEYILAKAGGAVGVEDGSLTDSTFLSEMTSSNLPAVQHGALALAGADQDRNIDFTGGVSGAFNMTRPVAGSPSSFANMSIGALSGGVSYDGTITPGTATGSLTYQLGGGGDLILNIVKFGNNAGGAPLINVNGVTTNALFENGGTVSLPTTNNYSGTTVINGAMVMANDVTNTLELEQTTLQVSHLADNASSIGNSSNSSANLVLNGGVLQYIGAGDTTTRLFTIGAMGATIDSSGAGPLTFSNTGAEAFPDGSSASTTLTLTGTNSGANTLGASLVDPTSSGFAHFPPSLTLVKNGTGFWQLTGNNSYNGGTILAGGVLEITNDANIGGSGNSIVFAGGTLRFTDNSVTNLDEDVVNWSTFNGGIHVNSGGVFTISENIGGTGSFTKQGNGELIFSGTNTYSGGTTINAGTLDISNFGQLGTGAIVDNGNLEIDLSGPTVFSGSITGTGNLIVTGATTLTLNGNNTYTGSTNMPGASTLILDFSTAPNPVLPILTGNLLLNSAALVVNPNSGTPVSNTFATTSFTAGASAITTTNSNVNKINLNLGTLIRGTNAPGATVIFNSPVSGATSSIQTASSSSTAALLALNSSGQYTGYATFGLNDWAATTISSGGNAFVVPGSAISGFYTPLFSTTSYTSTSNLDVVGTNQKLLLSSPALASLRFNTANGGFFNDGTNAINQVVISSAINTGAFLVTPNVGNNNVLITPNSIGNNQHTQDISITGGDAVFWQNNTGGLLILNTGVSAAGLVKQGPGIMAINATSTYGGSTYLENGILQVPYDSALGTGSTVNLFGGSLMAVQSFTTNRSFSVGARGGALIAGDGTGLTINGVISNSGALNIGSPNLISEAQTLSNSSNQLFFSTFFGSGQIIFNASNSYTGPTNVNAGQLRLGNAAALGGTSALNIAALASLDLNGNSISIPTLNGAGTIDDNTAGGNLTINVTGNGNSTFSGVIHNSTGAVDVTQSGGGTLVLSGSNTFTGPTNLIAGELSIGSAVNLSNTINFLGGVAQITGNTLQNFNTQSVNWAGFNGGFDIDSVTNTFTVSQNLGGTGSLLKLGLGTLALAAGNTYAGGTIIQAGALLIPDQTALGTGPVINNATIILNGAGTSTLSNNITGSGGIIDASLDLILTGSNTFTGAVTVNAGSTLALNSPGALPVNAEVLNNGLLNVNANASIGGVNGAGNTTVATGVTFYASGFNQTSLTNNGNTTIGCGGTVGTLAGTGVLTVGTNVMIGDLQIANNKQRNNQGGLTIVPGSQLDITNNSLAVNFTAGNDPVAQLVTYIKSGYKGGAWSGTGLTSSYAAANPLLAVGFADGSVDNGTPATASQVLIETTLNGDANLDGFVNFLDLVAVVQNFNKANTDWVHGDFHFGTSTNFQDLVTVVQNFNKSVAGLLDAQSPLQTIPLAQLNQSGIAPTDVNLPEPGFVGLAFAVGAGIIARRRRVRADKRS